MASKEEPDDQSVQTDEERADLEEEIYAEHHSIPEDTRQEVLNRDDNRCQINGCCGRARNGSAQLLVQQIDKTESTVDSYPEALETRCLRCSVWIAQMPTTDDLRPRIRERLNGVTIEPNHAEILQYLAEEGPATTGEIRENVNLNSKPGVRHGLYSLMGLDVREDSITEQIIVKNRTDQSYGLPWQIPDEHDARGFIPVRPAELRTRILDELVCRLSRHLDDKLEKPLEVIAVIVDRNPRQVRHMRRRGEAFQFPFESWADREQSREDPSAIIAAVDALAAETNNLSRQLLSRNIANVYESNDEEVVAEMLRAWAGSKDITPHIERQETTVGGTDEECDEELTLEAETECQREQTSTLTSDSNTSGEDNPKWNVQVLEEPEIETDSDASDIAEIEAGQGDDVGSEGK